MAKVEVYKYCSRFLVLSLLIIPIAVSAQYTLHIKPVDKDSAFLFTILKPQTSFKNQQLCMDYVNTKIPGLMYNKGYISASVDSIHYDSLDAELYIYVGEAFRWARLNTDSVEKEILNGVNWNKKEFEDKPVRVEQLQSIQYRFLDHLENNGYPFAKIELDSVSIDEGVLQARVKINKGPLYKIDSIRNTGKANISNRYLQRYLNILNGSIYKKSTLQSISRKLQELPFVEERQPWSITWLGTGSIINLDLDPQRSSQVNVLIGLLPATDASNNIYDAPRTKLQFTGEATINLRNALGNGEMIGLNWQQIQLKSPRLNLAYQQSYLFGSPYGINFAFDLFKKDTSFVTINMMLGVQYAVSSNQSGSLFVQNFQSNLITVDTNAVKQTKQLPQEADLHSISLGLRYEGYSTNYRFNPTNGSEWLLSMSAGSKKIKKNSVIVQLFDKNDPTFDYNSLYDTIRLKSFQFRINASMAHFFN